MEENNHWWSVVEGTARRWRQLPLLDVIMSMDGPVGNWATKFHNFFILLKSIATDTLAMESFNAKTCSDHLTCCM